MAKPEVWFAIPSASPERCRKVLPVWKKMGYKTAVLQNVQKADIPADIVEWFDYYPGWSGSINILAKKIVPSSATIVVSGGCDMLPDPNHTADELAEQFLERFPDGFGVMQPHGDEYNCARHYCGSPFLGRKWIDTMYQGRGPMCDLYQHNWGDVELYWVARCMNALWCREDLTHFHEHFSRDSKKPEQWWLQNVHRHDRRDVETFISRSWQRFPGHEPKGYDRVFDPRPLAEDTERFAEKHYNALYAPKTAGTHFTDAINRMKDKSLMPIAIYGSGAHTKRHGQQLADMDVDIACVIDDSPERQGKRLWGYPIVSREKAIAMGVRSVVLSSDAHEDKLWDNSAMFTQSGIHVERAYAPQASEKNRRVSEALNQLAARGKRRVAIYGAGQHTREIVGTLAKPPAGVEVIAIMDDAQDGVGREMFGMPLCSRTQAASMAMDAIVISSSNCEAQMWENTASFRERGVEVVRLYTHPAPVVVPARTTAAKVGGKKTLAA